MSIVLPELPWAKDALAPHISAETIEYHYGKHHAAYVTKLNAAISSNAELEGKSLDEIMKTSSGGVFNNAAQVWNHTFYWKSLSPSGGGEPTGAVKEAIEEKFGSFEAFKKAFSDTAAGHFGSGWAWLVKTESGGVDVVGTHDASNPVKEGKGTPILTCDVWEHAYYIDYRNSRPGYIAAWWNLVNWDFANENLAKC
ncbi:SOD [Ectocarpus sp. CCAP 1310/34]|nr:SOD [Ectocarpus sp. CCAP 1310/34]